MPDSEENRIKELKKIHISQYYETYKSSCIRHSQIIVAFSSAVIFTTFTYIQKTFAYTNPIYHYHFLFWLTTIVVGLVWVSFGLTICFTIKAEHYSSEDARNTMYHSIKDYMKKPSVRPFPFERNEPSQFENLYKPDITSKNIIIFRTENGKKYTIHRTFRTDEQIILNYVILEFIS